MSAAPGSVAKGKRSPSAEDGASTVSAVRANDGATDSKDARDSAAPLPNSPSPPAEDDGWESIWDTTAGTWYFYNRFTGISQWENPRVPEANAHNYASYDRPSASTATALPATSGAPGNGPPARRVAGGYIPAIHGNYDPNADYAQEASKDAEQAEQATAPGLHVANGQDYSTTGHFNRFTGKFQQPGMGPELHNNEHKSGRQMNAFFDVDAAANSHDGRSLKAERRNKHLSKKELKAYQTKRKEKKEFKRMQWLRD